MERPLDTDATSDAAQRTFLSLIESYPFGAYVVDADFRIAAMNARSRQSAFVNVRPVIGRAFDEAVRILWPEPVASQIIATFRHTLDTGAPFVSKDFVNQRNDIERVEGYEWELHRITLPDGRYGVTCFFFDSSELRQTERQLRDSEARLRGVFDQTLVGVAECDGIGRFVRVNRRFCEMVGRTAEELYGLRMQDITHADDLPRNLELYERAITDGRSFTIEKRYVRPDQSCIWVSNSVSLVSGEPGTAPHLVTASLDITERKRAEAELRASDERKAYLLRLGDALRPLADPGAVQEAAAELLGEQLRADRVAYFEVHGDDYVVAKDFAPRLPSVAGRYPTADFGARLLDAYRDGQSVANADVTIDPSLSAEEQAAYAALTIRAYAGVPLVKNGVLVAGLTVHMARPRAWTADEIELLHETAERTWAAVEHARSEERLRSSERQFRTLFESMDEGFCVAEIDFGPNGHALDYRIVDMNDAFERHTGLRQFQGKSVRESIPTLEEFWFETYGAVARTGVPARFIHQAEPMGGRWFDVNAFRLGGPESRRVAILFTDITARRQGELALRDSEAHFRSMADNAPTMLWVTDAFGACTYLSAQWYAFTGRTPAQDLGYGWLQNVHPEDREQAGMIFQDAVARRVPFSILYRLRRHDGEYRWAIDAARPRFEGDVFLGFVGSVTDVHEQHVAETRLRESTSQLALTIDATGVGMWLNTLPLGTLNWDARTRELFFIPPGVSPTIELFWQRLHPDDHAATRAAIQQAIATGTLYAIDHRVVNPASGAIRWIRSAGQASYDEHGRAVRFDGINYDITERKTLEEELRSVAAELSDGNRRKDEFLATLAHELRNPLAPLRNGVEVLRLAGDDSGPLARTRDMMERQVGQMARLIDDLLDLSRISRGQIALQKTRMPLDEALRDAVEMARPLIEGRGQELTLDLPPDRVYVDADRIRLAQVFGNLLNNAAKYTDKGGHIRVGFSVAGGNAEVRVEDDGVGIPTPMLARVFDMFAQVDRSLERAQGGLGIGLHIVKRLVAMHGGTIRAESEGERKGSRFIVSLPTVQPATAARPDASPSVGAAVSVTGRRILVVEDNADGAEILDTMLTLMGHQVCMASDGIEAIALAEDFRPDVILMDIGMPNMNGFDACRLIREQPWGKAIVMVAQTGWGQKDDKRKAREVGFDFHITKPVDPRDLEKILADIKDER